MDDVEIMDRINDVKKEVVSEIGDVKTCLSNLTTEIRVNNQKNQDEHSNLDSRIKKVEEKQDKKMSAYNNLLGPTTQSKLINIVIMLIIIIGTLVGANFGGLL